MIKKTRVIGQALRIATIGAMALTVATAPAHAQSRGDRAAERRAMAEQRMESIAADRAERASRRTDIFERMTNVTPDLVQDRLDQAELQMLDALAEADAALIASRANNAGLLAEEILTTQDIQRLSEEQVDQLVAAAVRATEITAEEVEILLAVGAAQLESAFDQPDAENIANTLNEIGATALGLPEVMAKEGPRR